MHAAGVVLMIIGGLVIALSGWDLYSEPNDPSLGKFIAMGLGALTFWFGYGPARNTRKGLDDDEPS